MSFQKRGKRFHSSLESVLIPWNWKPDVLIELTRKNMFRTILSAVWQNPNLETSEVIWAATSGNVPSHMCAQRRLRSALVRSPISDLVVRMEILGYPKCAQWRFRSDCTNAQADLNLRQAHMSEGILSDVAVYIFRAFLLVHCVVWQYPNFNTSEVIYSPLFKVTINPRSI